MCRLMRLFSIEILCWGMEKCWSYRGVRIKIVRLIEVFLWETHLRSAGTCESVRLREVSVLWDVRLKRFYCVGYISTDFGYKSSYRNGNAILEGWKKEIFNMIVTNKRTKEESTQWLNRSLSPINLNHPLYKENKQRQKDWTNEEQMVPI